ncbi:hypothetical protein M071_4565, partial [Bacteroides fragilis str. Ds-233]
MDRALFAATLNEIDTFKKQVIFLSALKRKVSLSFL